MKRRSINGGQFQLYLPDHIADWDAPSDWEKCRFASMLTTLTPNMTLLDIGAEHGWISACYATIVGPANMCLVEPSAEFWPLIRKTWEANSFPDPLSCYVGLMSDRTALLDDLPGVRGMEDTVWPVQSQGELITGGMPYRSLLNHSETLSQVTIDDWCLMTGIIPDAVTIDVEGAELDVLKGAVDTLTDHRPLVWWSAHPDLMERDYGSTPDDIERVMHAAGYETQFLGRDHEDHHRGMPL